MTGLITVVSEPRFVSSSLEVDAAETALGSRFPQGYREYVTEYGEGVLGGVYIRIYPPHRILGGDMSQWRSRIAEYWFWDDSPEILTQARALECTIIGDTLDGDEIVFHRRDPDCIFVLPRNFSQVFTAGRGLPEAIEWLCSAGVLTEGFTERKFEPFDSRRKAK